MGGFRRIHEIGFAARAVSVSWVPGPVARSRSLGPLRSGIAETRGYGSGQYRGTPGKALNMIEKLPAGGYRLYSRKKNPKTGKRRNLGTFKTGEAAKQHERAVQYFKRH